MMEPAISVIVPAFNVAEYIEECLRSILSQTWTCFEIIVINDGCTDQTAEIVQDISRDDDRVRLLQQSNSGVSIARNRGLGTSRGQYIAFVDGDDVIRPDFLSCLHTAIQDADLAVVGVENFRERNKWHLRRQPQANRINNHEDPLQLLRTFSTGAWEFPNWNKLYRASIIQKGKLQFKQDLAIGEDRLFNIQYLIHCNSVRAENYLGYGYRIRPESAFRGATAKQLWTSHCQAMRATQSTLQELPEQIARDIEPLFITSPTIHTAFPQLLKGLKNSTSRHSPAKEDLHQCLELAERSWFDPTGLSLSPAACWLFRSYSRGKNWPAVSIWNRRIT